MKNQNDLIISIVAGVLAIGISIALFLTKREPFVPAAAPTVNTAAVSLPAGDVKFSASLPGGGGGAAGGGNPFGGGGGGNPFGSRGGGPGGPSFGPGGPSFGPGGPSFGPGGPRSGGPQISGAKGTG
jgi:hypothetical protein